ncbi:MAG: hypothetical protein GW939_03285 [Candidatus Magasanikbacteria bacterium]|uniref:Uncharacterized protein n=1 Tax=Candidatus Magasanikbacteria bacterium CG10_big_fil_rev_8_21_14_0_10_38_6 TaxID=1974647 RepID=A0A2M6P069_9BACT|nr:hypothetical protein [Candidatus Magasanikbacteria bacterium]PIR77097.1 MAG: hypothetical protein COU30_04355 [Candidatus Magasanikbacteria bacterium CG10_big_fil_rev_8_21_14_0_10_38_6]
MKENLFTEREVIKMIWLRVALVCTNLLTWIWYESGWELHDLGTLEFIAGFGAVVCMVSAICWDTGNNAVRRYKFPRIASAMFALPSLLCTAWYYLS